MSDFKADAILLKKVEYGDHDLIISFLTDTHGKVSVMAKNAKKSVRRFSGALDLFSVYHIGCALPKKKKDALIILSSADLEKGHVGIRQDVLKTTYASYWVEIIHFWLEENRSQEEVYKLLAFALEALNRGETDMEVTNLFFQIRFMEISGFSPQIKDCNNCGLELDRIQENTIWFDFRDGRILCASCRRKRSRHGMVISKGTLKQLDWINQTESDRLDRIRFSKPAIVQGEKLLERFIPFHIGKKFKSLTILDQLRK